MRDATPPLQIRSASSVTLDDVAALFNAAYSDYAVPMQISRELLERMVRVFALDLAVSRFGVADGEPAALTLVGRRDTRAWLAGVGVAPAMRHRGYGDAITRAAVEEAHAHGAREVWLEVLDANLSARRIYEAIGFETVRHLGVWTRPARGGDAPWPRAATFPMDAPGALAWIAPRRAPGAPWQRATATFERGLLHYSALGLGDREAPGAVVLFTTAPDVVDVMELVADEAAHAETLLRALLALYPSHMLRMVNYAAADPHTVVFEAIGATPIWWQHEMVLRF